MRVTKLALARDWLARAEEDLDFARAAATLKPARYGGGLFHCQQAAEKALKGFLFVRDVPLEKTHDLRELVNRCKTLDPAFEALREDAGLLTPFAVRYRYPSDLSAPDRTQYSAGLAAAERVCRFVLSRCPELQPESA